MNRSGPGQTQGGIQRIVVGLEGGRSARTNARIPQRSLRYGTVNHTVTPAAFVAVQVNEQIVARGKREALCHYEGVLTLELVREPKYSL